MATPGGSQVLVRSVADPDGVVTGRVSALQIGLDVATPGDIGPYATPPSNRCEQPLPLSLTPLNRGQIVTRDGESFCTVHSALENDDGP